MKKNLSKKLFSPKGFTLIELLIVIAVIGVLAAGILALIDPIDKINAANDSRVQADISALGRASENYSTQHNASYAKAPADMVGPGEIRAVPDAPGGYTAYIYTAIPAACTTAGEDCLSITITGQLKSKKYADAGNLVWKYESASGKNCAVDVVATVCP